MEIRSENEGLGCHEVYQVLGVMNGDIDYYLRDEELDFDTALVGSAALAVYADRQGIEYSTDTKDIDLYANSEIADLEKFQELPLAGRSREDGSQIKYDTTSASTCRNAPEVFVDVITDYEAAFNWRPEDATEVEKLLTQEIKDEEPITHGKVNVHLPKLETLKKTFQYSGRDYTQRIELINDMLEN